MALNDWADRTEDAVERPRRPLPSGRIPPGAALAAAGALTAAGLGLAARAGRPALTVAGLLAGTVWAYDLKLKHTPAGPAAMAAARGLDLLLGATATQAGATRARASSGGGAAPVTVAGTRAGSVARAGVGAGERGAPGALRQALPSSAVLAAHTFAVTTVSRREAQGGSALTPLAALAATAVLGGMVSTHRAGTGATRGWGVRIGAGAGAGVVGAGVVGEAGAGAVSGAGTAGGVRAGTWAGVVGRRAGAVGAVGAVGAAGLGKRPDIRLAPHQLLGALYIATAARPLFHAALNPSPYLTQRAVGGGIRAMIPLQAALAARAGSFGTALATAALAPVARRLGRRVSAT